MGVDFPLNLLLDNYRTLKDFDMSRERERERDRCVAMND